MKTYQSILGEEAIRVLRRLVSALAYEAYFPESEEAAALDSATSLLSEDGDNWRLSILYENEVRHGTGRRIHNDPVLMALLRRPIA
jgi:siderophore synthetase component